MKEDLSKIGEGKIFTDLDTTLKELVQVLLLFGQEEFNTIPHEGSWTAGQVAEHLRKSNGSFAQLLNGNTETSTRKPNEKAQNIKTAFSDLTIKFKSPEFVIPEDKLYNKILLIEALKNINKQIEAAVDRLDLSKICLDFEAPVLGKLTRLEILFFITYHTRRHIHQLKNILQELKNASIASTTITVQNSNNLNHS